MRLDPRGGIPEIATAEDLMIDLAGPRARFEPPEFIVFPVLSHSLASQGKKQTP
jgi:hypothetical protein